MYLKKNSYIDKKMTNNPWKNEQKIQAKTLQKSFSHWPINIKKFSTPFFYKKL